jgi:hypothetical protein
LILRSYHAVLELVVPKSMPIDGALSLILVVALEGGVYLIGATFVQGGGTFYVREQEGEGDGRQLVICCSPTLLSPSSLSALQSHTGH